ncbi:MAG TPA: exodeoxyribonuclease VII large subunit [Smithella sp.]|nr:exodeoxyribonuclease VII large subunit [Smithella sp.]HNY50490.1 exodeoxyribonuclease VII large subunit [Smithella sp.]HOG90182.1 exodeoxyribonuclease VII large subunit [Smithella sp.]HOU50768.1 exodeoxyribonuclease VII large subunit [Smithella sp.]HQG65273.1 exodeoxyribonuclease VII large subunit [Smithella sp.]
MEDILTVSQLNNNIKFLLEETLDFVLVEGEVSNLRRPQSGHVYFTLKDEQSQIRAVFFRQFGVYQRRNHFELEEGLKVLCRARLNVYLPRGEYQLVVESVEPLGVGALQKAFEQLKAKLFAEGLFDACHKKSLPFLPERIAVVTSPTGAVIRDILNITKRRFPSVDVLIAPVRVQGNEAVDEIIRALRNVHAYGGVDVIIIARGGGSLEDIAPFNDEALAREIFRSTIPIVSAVGHETDFTICDFVADLRAPTPSAAAELIVPQRLELLSKINTLQQRTMSGFFRQLDDYREQLADLQVRLKDPRRFVADLKIGVDELRERLTGALQHKKQNIYHELRQLELRLLHQSPVLKIREKKFLLQNLQKELSNNILIRLTAARERLMKNSALLESISPLAVLQRGYSITRRVDSAMIVRQTDDLSVGDNVNVLLARGNFNAKIEKIF